MPRLNAMRKKVGMLRKMRTEKVKVGDKFSMLTVNRFLGTNKHKKRIWECLCECGGKTIVPTSHLLSGHTKSCGCKKIESPLGAAKIANTRHGLTKSKEYHAWAELKQRCYNPKNQNYKNYGERGIKVCSRWVDSFENFYTDMGKAPHGYSIDRIDVNGDYCKENCRWADNKTQQYNKRCTVKITYNGKTESILYWSDTTGISVKSLYDRIYRMKWTIERALTSPLRRKKA